MARRGPSRRSLANRYTVLVAVLVAATTLILGSALASGVHRMAQSEESARQSAQSEIIVRDVASRLQATARVLRTVADRDVVRGEDDRAAFRALAGAYVDNAEYLRGITLIDLDSTSGVAYPLDEKVALTPALASADVSAGVEFVWIEPDASGPGSLLVVVPARLANGHDGLLVGTARTQFIDEALKQLSFSDKRPTAAIIDATGASVFAAGDPAAYRDSTITVHASEDPNVGTVDVSAADGGARFTGVFSTIAGLTGLDWRVVVAEPEGVVAQQTWQALKPAVFAWGAASLVALLLAVVSVTFLARPLRVLDERARAAASGELLEPLPVTRHDEIGRLIESFNSVALRLNRMHDMSQLLASSSDLDEVLDRILSSLSHILDANDVDILLLDDDGALRLVRAAGSLAGAVGSVIPATGSAWLQKTIDSGDTERFTGEPGDDWLLRLHQTGLERPSAIAVPLAKGRVILGIVTVVRTASRVFTQAEAEVARSFAAQASVALDNARLFEQERRSRREAEALRRIAETMGASAPLVEALETTASIEAELMGADYHAVLLAGLPRRNRDEQGDATSASFFELWERLGQERGLQPGLPVALTEHDANEDVAAALGRLGMHTVVVTPVSVKGRLACLLVLGWSEGPYALDRHGTELCSAIGNQVSLAFENVELFEDARTRADNLETIFRISQAVSSSLQSKVVLNRVLDVVQKILSADAVMLMTLDPDRSLMVVPMARGILNPEMLQMEFASGVDLPGRVFAEKEPVSIADLSTSDSRLARVAFGQDLGSAVFVPLLARGRSIGVLAVFARSRGAFAAEDVELLRTFATQAALAIDTANLFSREHHVASVLQQSILPTRLPTIPGIDASSVYVPAGSEVEIGGDYYDLFMAPDGRVVLAIGDVCGKGVEAATKTSMIKYSIRGMIAAGARPDEVLAELNAALVSADDPSDIVTVWLGLLDTQTGRLSWANGGHPPGMLLQPSGTDIVRLGTTGALLGAVRMAEYGESEVIVEPGGTVLLYTDGVTEARNKGRFFGEGRVRRALRQAGTAAVVTQRLLSFVQRFSHGDLRDDAAILTVVLKHGDRESGADVSGA